MHAGDVNAEVNFPKSAVLKVPSLGSGDEPVFTRHCSSFLLGVRVFWAEAVGR